MSGVTVRLRSEEDLPGLVAILERVQQRRGYPDSVRGDLGAWLSGRRVWRSWVAVLDDELAGQVSLATAAGDHAEEVWTSALGQQPGELAVVKRLFVEPALEGRGIGRLLLDTSVAEAHRRGLRPVLDVTTASTAALALYKRAGFSVIGTIDALWSRGEVHLTCLAGPPPPAEPPEGPPAR